MTDNRRNPTSREFKRAKADLEALTPEEWQPVDGDELGVTLEGQPEPAPGSMFAVGRSGLVFIQSPDGGLTIVTGGIETIQMPTLTGGPDSIRIEQKGDDLFLYVDDRKIAKRGRPDGRFARKWIPIVPDVRKVIDTSDTSIMVEYRGGKAH